MTANGSEASAEQDVAPAEQELVAGTTLCPGTASGALLVLSEPLSFWGGTNRKTGEIIDSRHPQHGTLLGGRVVMMDASRGSSSSSSVLAEQIRAGVAPAAILLTARDAIVALGAMAAAELYGINVPVVLLDAAAASRLATAASTQPVSVTAHAKGSAHVVFQACS